LRDRSKVIIIAGPNRLMLQPLSRHFAVRESFAFEATPSGRGYLQQIRHWQADGHRVKLARRKPSFGARSVSVRVGTTFPRP